MGKGVGAGLATGNGVVGVTGLGTGDDPTMMSGQLPLIAWVISWHTSFLLYWVLN